MRRPSFGTTVLWTVVFLLLGLFLLRMTFEAATLAQANCQQAGGVWQQLSGGAPYTGLRPPVADLPPVWGCVRDGRLP